MRAGISILILIAVSTGAFAEDKNQSNVYDDFSQWMKPLPNATVGEEITALIKRHMANLLYPVDMTSFARPETDAKFREQIIILQKQMGEPATGTLTSDQFGRLAEAARDVDDRVIGTSLKKLVDRSKNGEWVSAVGTGTTDDGPLAHPINISRIFCLRASGTCELSTAEFSPEDSQIYFAVPYDYSITTWDPSRVTATIEGPCDTALMSIDIKNQSVVISWVPHSDLSFCLKEKPSTWRLANDGFPITWKIHQDKVNKARALVYEPEKRLVPPVADASSK